MAVHKRADAIWRGSVAEGAGHVSTASGTLKDVEITWPKRSEQGEEVTSPEELIAAAHASCFAMALSGGLSRGGNPPDELRVRATVGFQAGEGITGVQLDVTGKVPGIDQAAFEEAAAGAAANCPVSKALAGVEITHTAALSR